MNIILSDLVSLLFVAIVVALIARRFKLPYTVGLVVAGAVAAFTHAHLGFALTHDFIFEVILPPLLFEAAINIHWHELRRDSAPVLVLALLGTIVAATAVTVGMIWCLHWQLRPAILFGVLIAATDPVAVIAMFKDNQVTGRLRLLVESESLLNDGAAAVLFTLVLAWASPGGSEMLTTTGALKTLALTVGGGLAIGAATAAFVLGIAGRTTDHLVESTLTTVAAYGSFLAAEYFHASGVLATVTAGLVIGNFGILAEETHSRISQHGREFALALWDFIAFIANSLVFLLIGLTVAAMQFSRYGVAEIAVVILMVLIARALTVYPLCLLFRRTDWQVPMGMQHVLWWGGLRGALGLALALSLPPWLPRRNEILVIAFAVVVFSVVLQGLTMPLLLRKLKFI